jgi:N-acetylglutamate synthase-like GNAT family acetyltransferase
MNTRGTGWSIKIRQAREQDSEDVARVLRLAFLQFEGLYTERAFAATTPDAEGVAARLREGPIWLAVHEESAVGTASVVSEFEQCYIRGVAVLPDWRARGVGCSLMATIERFALQNKARRLFLTTTPFLDDAIRFYIRLGFERTNDAPHDLYGTPLFGMTKSLRQDEGAENI